MAQSSLQIGGAPARRLTPGEPFEGVSTPRPPIDGHESSHSFAGPSIPSTTTQPSSSLLVPPATGSSSDGLAKGKRPEKISIEVNTPLGTRRPVSELDDHMDHTPPTQLPVRPNRRGSSSSILDADGEKYTGVLMKTSSSRQGKQNLRSSNDPLGADASSATSGQENGKNTVLISMPEDSDNKDAAKEEGIDNTNEKQQKNKDTPSQSAESPIDSSPDTGRTLFNLKGIRDSILQRLLNRQNDKDNDYIEVSSPGGSNERGHLPEGMVDPAEALRNMGSPAGASSITMAEIPDYNEEAREVARKITSNRREPQLSGGILSNLLRLQALSQASSSKSRRHSHRDRRHPNSRRRSASRPSGNVDIPLTGSGRHRLSTPSASVLSLPGLALATPSGIGYNHAMTTMLPPMAGHAGLATSTHSARADSGAGTGSATAPASPRVSTDNSATPTRPPFSNALSAPTTPTRTHAPRLEPHHFLQAGSARSSISFDDDVSLYSSMSQDPLLAAYRLTQQAQLTEAVAEILLKQDLLIRLCKSLIRYGAPSHRIELAMEAMCKTLGVDGSFAFLPGLMMISFGDADTHTSETHLIKCGQGFDLGRLDKVNKIARALVYGKYTPAQALDQLKAVNAEKPLYGMWKILLSFTVSSGLVAPLAFRGSWYDMLAAGGLGTVVGLTSLLASRYSVYSNVFEVSTSIVIAFLAKALREYVCFTGVVLSAIVMLLPGLSLTTAIMELSSRYMVSGSVRMFYSLIYCLFLGFGLSIGSQLWDVFTDPPQEGDPKTGYCHPATEPWRWALFPFLAIAFNVQLHATPRQWPVMVICSAVGLAVSEILGKYWPSSLYISAAVSAFVSGLIGNIYERLTHELAFVPILGAILLIVPGGMGVRSSLLLLEESSAGQGTAFALQMILVALGIAVGLFASTLVVYPLGKKRNVLLTF
ncbi:hypothetical protein BGW42_000904 [Actinomortierella wolfii]|nr:hypothetical protein BGW42_000904 [Actinomortierella wolfii]